MVYSIEVEIAFLWSIKKETFMEEMYLPSERKKTAIPGYEYNFAIQQKDADAVIYFRDTSDMGNSTIKEMTLTIPSANFKAGLSNKTNILEDGFDAICAIKREDILNPKKNFFVDDILTLEFRGIVECNEEPYTESLGVMLFKAKDKDFTFVIGSSKIMAHKFILRRYSSVFSEMFKSNINQIKITDFDYYVLFYVLLYCYDMPMSGNRSVDLLFECLRFANVYDMPIIKEQISNKLATYLKGENVCKFANKSVEYNAPTLKGYCINFISKWQRDGKRYNDALNLNIEIVHELYKSTLWVTESS